MTRDEMQSLLSQRGFRYGLEESGHAALGYNIANEHAQQTPIAMRLICEDCGVLHIDEGEFATKPHHTHACQHCGLVWRPAVACTVGVQFLPGFKNEQKGGSQ